ncbi:MAG: hypothetical protein J6Z08_02650 [Elusimicrobiales bacterium]|nr:hypothetical protein [Elusimicrobiales bacterium]
MRKIKKFKIPVYTYEIARMCRKTGLNLDLTGLGAERDFKEYISLLASTLEPSVVFDYFPPDDEDTAVIGSDSASRNPSTIAILTLGSPFADRTATEKEDTRRQINITAAISFLQAAVKVISDLSAQEATREGFVFSKPLYIYSKPDLNTRENSKSGSDTYEVPLYRDELLAKLVKRLEAEKIGIFLNDGLITPEYSCVFRLEWLIKQKRK